MNPFKDVFKGCDKFGMNSPDQKVEHIFSLHKIFEMNTSQLQVTNYLSEIKFAHPRFDKFFVVLFLFMTKL